MPDTAAAEIRDWKTGASQITSQQGIKYEEEERRRGKEKKEMGDERKKGRAALAR